MAGSDCTILEYNPEFREGVLDVLKPLWGPDTALNRKYFQWKYEDNPYSTLPPGIVAICRRRVVGFRGFFPQPLHVPGLQSALRLLSPGDTCVVPSHRKKGLSIAMFRAAMNVYGQSQGVFLNATCGRSSYPGYLKLGFTPLAPRACMMRYTPIGFLKYAFNRAMHSCSGNECAARPGGDVAALDAPPLDAMCRLAGRADKTHEKVGLVRDAAFLRWRFANPKNKYIYYCSLKKGEITGYVVLGFFPYNDRAYILDYTVDGSEAFGDILRCIIRSRRYDVLGVHGYCLDSQLLRAAEELGFKKNGLLHALDRRNSGVYPLLIRPFRENFGEQDFMAGSCDFRTVTDWSLKPIIADNA